MRILNTFFTVILALVITCNAFGQIDTPRPSPQGKVTQTVGLTDIAIEYSRPGVKDRTIFGGLLAYGEIWRTGANSATTISFSDDVKLEGNSVPAGEYALYTIPGKEEWTIIIYKDVSLGGNVADYDQANELVRFKVAPQKLPMKIETLTFDVGDIRNTSAKISLMWEETKVDIKLEVEYDSIIMADIKEKMENPLAQAATLYIQSANYYFNEGKDLNQALEWMNKGLEISTSSFNFFNIHRKSMIQAELGDYKGATATAKDAHKLGEEASGGAKIFYNDVVKGQLDENMAKWGKEKKK